MRFFPRGLEPGDPLAKRGIIAGMRAMAHALETLSIHGGRIDWQNGEPKIIMGSTAGLVPGRATGDPDSGGARGVVTVPPFTENAPPGDGEGGVPDTPPGYTGNISIVSNVLFEGQKLKKQVRMFEFEGGVLMDVSEVSTYDVAQGETFECPVEEEPE